MNINICKVNTRYIILCVFVAFLLAMPLLNSKNTHAQTPTLNPTEAENKRRRDLHEQLEESRDRYVQTGLSQEQLKMQSTKEIWSILGRLFRGIGLPEATPSPGFIPPPGINPPTEELQGVLPAGDPPAGRCTNLVNQALVNLGNHPSNLEVYRQASAQTSVPWEAIAAIHYIETGGSFNPNGSCISGRPIGAKEPDNGDLTYSSLLETCIAAAEEFKGKTGMVNYVVGKNGMTTPNSYQMLAGQFASYNSPTQSECAMGPDGAGYDFIYTGATWPGIPDNGQCRPKGEKFVGDRHIYATACLDAAHENMWFHFHYGGEVREYTNRVGAITLIRAIQKTYQTLQPTGVVQPTISYQQPTGNFVYYNQCDPSFQNSSWGSCGRNGTPLNCYAGCGPTSVAQIIATYANASYTPNYSMAKAVSWGSVSCEGSGVGTLYRLMDEYSSGVRYGSWTTSSGDFNQDARNMKPYIDQGWTILAAASYTPCCGHWIWIVDIDENYNIWANDVYWAQEKYIQGASVPINLTAFINGGYYYKNVTNINVSGFSPVRRK